MNSDILVSNFIRFETFKLDQKLSLSPELVSQFA